MGYDFYIGEAEIDPEDASVIVKRMALENAPSFPGDDMTRNGNSRHPGYSAWTDFCRRTGLFDLFYREGHLIGGHPGAVKLTKKHFDAVAAALDKHKTTHPNAKPGWCECMLCSPYREEAPMPAHVELDGDLARLIWLEFWIGWALKNCTVPTLYNH